MSSFVIVWTITSRFEIHSVTSHVVYDIGLRPLACWDCRFESRQWHRCLSLVSVVYCQVEVSATGRSLVRRRSPTECGVSVCELHEWNAGS